MDQETIVRLTEQLEEAQRELKTAKGRAKGVLRERIRRINAALCAPGATGLL